MENLFKAFASVMLIIIVVVGLVGIYPDDKPATVDLSSIESRLSNIEANQVNTDATNAEVTVDTSAMEASIAAYGNILDDLMDEAYSVEKVILEEAGLEAYEEEYSQSDLKDALEDLIVGYDRLVFDNEDEDFGDNGVKYTIVNLGLNDDEEKEIVVQKLLEIKYELDDTTDELKADVLVTGTVTYDDDDGFEADLVFTLA